MISLPDPKLTGDISLEEAISKRRSSRNFVNNDLTMEQVSQILWSAQGLTDKLNKYRAAPSAGSRYPMEIHVLTATGMFHYHPAKHALEQLRSEDIRPKLIQAALGQKFIAEAGLILIISAFPEKILSRYGDKGMRYIYQESGHIAQNVHLQAVAAGLIAVPIGAFTEDALKAAIDLPDELRPLYIIPVGYKKA
ncbi:MAG: SagB/ThcOx family dehydrogenase [Elusimicrobia bacterium]|nr:SagB/ThcOx family dehydrogenase [Candidatus Liberimonas magnetica]